MSEVTKALMEECLDPIYKSFIRVANSFLSKMSTAELDKIPTIKMSEEEKKTFDNNATVIDVLYGNDKGYISLYCIGSTFIKIVT